jgi:hypothetical protein
MSLKTQIIEKCKTEKSRGVLLSQLALIERGVQENGVLKKVNGDEELAVRTQLHWELHDLNGGGNKTYSVEHIAGLVGLILMTRAWDGYLTGTGVTSSMSFKAFLADNKLDLEHVQYCLDKCARELMEDFLSALKATPLEIGRLGNAKRWHREKCLQQATRPVSGSKNRLLKKLIALAATSEEARVVYEQYLSGKISVNKAAEQLRIKESPREFAARRAVTDIDPYIRTYVDDHQLTRLSFVQFALNYVVDQFKDGIPPDLLEKYVQESPAQ